MIYKLKPFSIPLSSTSQDILIKNYIASTLSIQEDDLLRIYILKKSLDARNKSSIKFHYVVEIELKKDIASASHAKYFEKPDSSNSETNPLNGVNLKNASSLHNPIIVGSGPAGLFAGWLLLEAGLKPIIIERGAAVEEREKKIAGLWKDAVFDPESNYCFGEGGAGTFSDGKLTTGKRHPWISYLFKKWVSFGAPEDILIDAHPHIGSDFLTKVVKNMRESMKVRGATFFFNTKFIDLNEIKGDARYEVSLSNGEKLNTNYLILAIGHSARDTYELLHKKNVSLTAKSFAIGARIEHPQEIIDEIQFGKKNLNLYRSDLPASDYKLTARAGDRGIWSFCMCPGGYILPTGAEEGCLAVNGMSLFARDSGFANAALVANITPDDFGKNSPLDGMKFQRMIEQKAYEAGGSSWHAPAEQLFHFLGTSKSNHLDLASSTYRPGITPYSLNKVLPDFVTTALQAAMKTFDKKMHGFIHEKAVLVGVETKTSSPLTINRNKNFESVSHTGIFPAGEGAGYAGGIVSAALDGLRVARSILDRLNR